jgi:hypothetical protein
LRTMREKVMRKGTLTEEKRRELVEAIERECRCRLSPDLRKVAVEGSERFLQEAGANRRSMKADLIRLQKQIRALLDTLRTVNIRIRECLDAKSHNADPKIDHLETLLQEIDLRIRERLDDLPDKKGGPNSPWGLNQYVVILAHIYKTTTGRRAGRRGGFALLARACLECLGESYHSDSTIDTAIRTYSDLEKSLQD